MSGIAIIADTDCSLPADVAAQHGIRLVPIKVQFGEEAFDTGIDIDDAAVFARVDREGKLPTTSAPSPGAFGDAFQAAFSKGADALICLCVSSEVSATYSAACTAREMFPERDIAVMDTRSLSLAQGFMALAAAEAACGGATVREAVAAAEDVGRRAHLFAALSTVRYLAMSGRVGYVAAGMATLLSVKPILTVRNGKLDLLERVRTQRKAWARTIELAAEAAGGRGVERAAILHVNAPAEAQAFARQVRVALACPEEMMVAELTPGLSVHAGAGLVGIALVVAG